MSMPLQRYIADPKDVERYDVCSNAKDFEPDGVFYLAADVARVAHDLPRRLRRDCLHEHTMKPIKQRMIDCDVCCELVLEQAGLLAMLEWK